MAGACATILKAAFDGRVQFNTLPDGTIVRANENGHSLVSYTGSDANQKSTAMSFPRGMLHGTNTVGA